MDRKDARATRPRPRAVGQMAARRSRRAPGRAARRVQDPRRAATGSERLVYARRVSHTATRRPCGDGTSDRESAAPRRGRRRSCVPDARAARGAQRVDTRRRAGAVVAERLAGVAADAYPRADKPTPRELIGRHPRPRDATPGDGARTPGETHTTFRRLYRCLHPYPVLSSGSNVNATARSRRLTEFLSD